MKILEQYIQGKENNPDTCEDGLYIGEDIIAVLDGVTAKSTYLWNGVSSGCYGKNVIIDFLKKQPLTDEYSVASEPFNPLQRAIHSER